MAMRLLLNHVVRRITRGHYRYHLFVRARKTEAPFRWHFPPRLFDYGHLGFVLRPTDSRVVMGQNDQLHLAPGWGALATGPEGKPSRRSSDVGSIYLVGGADATRVRIVASNGGGTLHVWQVREGSGPDDEKALLAWQDFATAPGRWTELEFPLTDEYRAGVPVHVRLSAPDGVDVHAVTLA
jgi:hypothetical protein